MRTRALDSDGDWTFGAGRNNYKRDMKSVSQNISTRLASFLGDCFFDLGAGLDWLNLLGAKDQTPLNLAISAVILNTQDVTGLLQLSIVRDADRNVTVRYRVQTAYSPVSGTFTLDQSGSVG